jgi:hypothetical protein
VASAGEKVILVRIETSPDDIHGIARRRRAFITSTRWHDLARGRGRARHGQTLRIGLPK